MRELYTTLVMINDNEEVYATSDCEDVMNGEVIGFGDTPEEARENWNELMAKGETE